MSKAEFRAAIARAGSTIMSTPDRVKYSEDQPRDDNGRFAGGPEAGSDAARYAEYGRYGLSPKGLEVHSHMGPNGEIRHSHAEALSHHTGYGPATLDIDRRMWSAQTGLRGGGRKEFTKNPKGPQVGDAVVTPSDLPQNYHEARIEQARSDLQMRAARSKEPDYGGREGPGIDDMARGKP
jgi:hypothetical protein